jgi:5-methylcytosine-specific restriction endonuclease McrA
MEGVREFAGGQGRLSGGVLVLNATFEPLHIISLRRAIILVLKDKAEVVEAAEARIRSENLALDMPLVIRLVYYVRVPHRLLIPLTRRTILARDQYTCQYCGAQPPKAQLTLDHVVPRCRGGRHAYHATSAREIAGRRSQVWGCGNDLRRLGMRLWCCWVRCRATRFGGSTCTDRSTGVGE